MWTIRISPDDSHTKYLECDIWLKDGFCRELNRHITNKGLLYNNTFKIFKKIKLIFEASENRIKIKSH